MIKIPITQEMVNRISSIDGYRSQVGHQALPPMLQAKLRKNSTKRRAYSSNRIEGNPLSEEEVSVLLEEDVHKHYLAPEQEILNYVQALEYLEIAAKEKVPFSKELILRTQEIVEQGASAEKIGLRGPMPPGFLFAVYNSETGKPDYIPPQAEDVPGLLDELVEYVNRTEDHPLLIAAAVHYQLVTIHPFEDGNGRTARLLSGYILDAYGYGFGGIGSLEEYFAYDTAEYYRSLQMNLPVLYYNGRENPPHLEIWVHYFLRMVELHARKAAELCAEETADYVSAGLSHLKKKEKKLLLFLMENKYEEFAPISISILTNESNRTIINRCVRLVEAGFLVPIKAEKRVLAYRFSELTREKRRTILRRLRQDRLDND